MSIKFNPLIFSGFDLTGGAGVVYWASPVATEGDLPVPASQDGEARVVQDTDKIYIWDATTSKWIDTGITLAAFGGTSAEGLTTSTSTSGNITHRTLQLNEASSTTPGAVSTGAQNFAGEKTFDDLATASSGVETDSIDSITGGAGVLSVGVSNASTINIGDTGVNVNLYGNTFYQDVTNLQVTDKQITLNKDGAIASAFNSGIELEEGGSITGYVSTSGDRASWELKPPGVAGTATISPGAAGITIDQSSHDPVTLGAVGSSPNADGATLTNQVLNLEPADATNPGVITAGTQTIGGAKTFNDEITASGGIYYAPATPTDWPAPAPDQIAPAIDELASRFTNQNTVTKEPTGFPNRTDSVISFNDSTREFTIDKTGSSFDFYIKGNKFTKTTAQTITLPDLNGNHYIYFNDSGVLASTQDANFVSTIITDYAFVSVVYWNNETAIPAHVYFAEERHGLTMDGVTHGYLHTVFGARYLAGLALQGFTIGSGGSDADAQFTSDQGTIRDEDIRHLIPAQAQIPILYRQGQLWRKKAADAYPVVYSGSVPEYTGANGRLPYNQYTGGAWQLTQIGNSEYVLVHFFGTNDKDNPVVGIQGINSYNSVASARIGANSEITSLSGLPFAEFVPVGSVIFESSNSFGNAIQARVYPTDTGADYVDFRGTQLYTPAGEATTHGLLSGLNSDDHIQYLLVDGTRAMSGALDMGNHTVSNMADGVALDDAVTLQQLQNATTSSPLTFAGYDASGVLSPVPGWVFDNSGAAQIGAQNSLVVPAGVTDFGAIVLSPTVSNPPPPTLTNLSAIQINPAINEQITNYYGVQLQGYGTSAPDNYLGFASYPNFSGTSSTITHFSAANSVAAPSLTGFNFQSTQDNDYETVINAVSTSNTSLSFNGLFIDKSGNGGDVTGVIINSSVTGGNFVGFHAEPSGGTFDNLTGLKVDFSFATAVASRPIGVEINQGSVQQNLSFQTTSSLPQLVDNGNLFRNTFEIANGSPISGTDVVLNNLSGFIKVNDTYSGSALGLGIVSVGFVSQLAGSGVATADSVAMSLAGASIDATSTGGTISDLTLYKGLVVDGGGTLTISNLYGLKIEGGVNALSDKAGNAWGVSVEDVGAENYLAKSLVIGGLTKVVSDIDVALEIQEPKTLVLGNATTVERTSVIDIPGALIYDTDLSRPFYNDGAAWKGLGLPPGDIDQTSFTALDNTAVASNIIGLAFSNAITRGFDAQVSIERDSTYAEYTLKGIQKGGSWEMSQDFIGDTTGISFSITSAGQIQYTSTNTGFDATLKFRANTV